MDEERTALVIELAKEFMELARQFEPSWIKGYFRFCSDGSKYGSNASFASDSKVMLVDPFKYQPFFSSMNDKGLILLKALNKEQGLFLLTIDASYNYTINFEYENLDRWRITKINGGTGVPIGI